MTATLTISQGEREALHWLLCRRLFILGQDLRLMHDLGWGPERPDTLIALTMPRDDLLRALKRLRRDARRGPCENRHELEAREADDERWMRFRGGVAACELLLARLDPSDPTEVVPAEFGCCPAEDGELRPYSLVSDGLILAAAEWAECHEKAEEVWVNVLTEHLGFEPEPATNVSLFPQLESLRRAGLLTSTEKRGEPFWSLTDAGREMLADFCEAGEVGHLPESPQHRAWRKARVKAALQIDGLREEMDQAIEAADRIHFTPPLKAKELFALSERLRWALWRFASATYCLTEWAEPHDDFPDEVAALLARGGAGRVRVACRTPPNLTVRKIMGASVNIHGLVLERLPLRVADQVGWLSQRRLFGKLDRYGLPRSPIGIATQSRRQQAPAYDSGFVGLLKSGRIEIVAAVEGFDGEDVLLADGTRIQPQAVITATGYGRGLRPLIGHLGVLDEDGKPLVGGGSEHPSARGLFFNGYRSNLSGQLRLMRLDARAIARAVKKRRP